ncbi:MAG: Glutaryl-CoA dehydrogenase, partial [uncultured Blastococcus sp.]
DRDEDSDVRLLRPGGTPRRGGPGAAAPGPGLHGHRGPADHQRVLDAGGVPAPDHPGAGRAGHRRHPVLRARVPGQVGPARRHDRHGAVAGGPVGLHLHGRARRPRHGLDAPLRLRGAEGALASGHGPDGADRRLRAHRARLGLRRRPRAAHDRAPGRRRLGPQRPEEVDRQRQLRRPGHHLGAGRRHPARARVRRRAGHRRHVRDRPRGQDRAACGAERRHHAPGRPRARGEPAAGGQQLQGHRQGPADDAGRGGLVGGGLLAGGLRARVALRPGAHAVRQAHRGLPAGAGPAGPDARQHHVVGGAVHAAVAAAGGGPDDRRAGLAGQGVQHRSDARDGRLGAGAHGRERHPAGAQRRPVRRRRRGDLLLRRHPRGQHPHRGPGHHRHGRHGL